jgi:arylsulfatase A-like enzyme
MRFSFPGTVTQILLISVCCLPSFAQSFYPPILIDSNALREKLEYLDYIDQTKGQYKGPNIIIILVDDLGKNDITLYDSTGVETPNINRMASEGIVFTHAYAASAVCNPSRAGLLTGRYPQRFGGERQIMSRYAKNKFEHFVFKHLINTRPLCLIEPWYSPSESEIKKQGLPESEVSLFEVMHHAGYKTVCIGKWHLGYNQPFLPQDKGIDHFFGFYEAFSLYSDTRNREVVNYKHKTFQNKHIWHQKRKGPSAIVQNGEEVEVHDYLTTRFAEEACQFIRQNENHPFLLYIPFNAPHTPFQAPKSYCDKFDYTKDKNKRVYYAMIAALDDAIGEIMGQVKASGMEENTLIFFASDNGGATYTGATTNGDMKGGKITNFEGGLNVPFIMKWKGTLLPGHQYNEPVSLMDIFTTTFASCKIPPPRHIMLDGVDIIPRLTGVETKPPHDYLYWRTDYNKTVRHGKWKLIVNARDNLLILYDLEADRQERYDLKDQHPEIVEQLLEKLAAWERGMKSPAWPGVMEYEQEIDGVKMRFAL